MLKNAYLDAKIGFDPAENEPPKLCPGPVQLPSGAVVPTGVLPPQVEESKRGDLGPVVMLPGSALRCFKTISFSHHRSDLYSVRGTWLFDIKL